MSKCTILFTSMAVVVLLSGAAKAELVNFTANVPFEWTPSGYVLLQDVLSSMPSVITMNAEFASPPGVHTTNGSSTTVHVTLNAVNNLGWTWTGYLMELNSDPAYSAKFVDGSASSDAFGVPDSGNDYNLEWHEGAGVVLAGNSTKFDFDLILSISGTGSTNYSLTQTPIPEPAMVALLGLGTVVLLARRKRQ